MEELPVEWLEGVSGTLLSSPDSVDDEFLQRCDRAFESWLAECDDDGPSAVAALADAFVLVAPLVAVHWAPLLASADRLLDRLAARVHVKEIALAFDAICVGCDRPTAARVVRMLKLARPAVRARSLPAYVAHMAADWRCAVVAPRSPRARMRTLAAAHARDSLAGGIVAAAEDARGHGGDVAVRNVHGFSPREVELASSPRFFDAAMVEWTSLAAVHFPAALAAAFPRASGAPRADLPARLYLEALGALLVQLPHAQSLAMDDGDALNGRASAGAGRELADARREERASATRLDVEYGDLVLDVLATGSSCLPLASTVASFAASYLSSSGEEDKDGDDSVLLGVGVWVLYHAKVGLCAPIFGGVLSPAARATALLPAAVQMLRSPHPAVASKGVELAAALLQFPSTGNSWSLGTLGPDSIAPLLVAARALLQYAERESASMLLSRRAIELLGRLMRRCASEARYVTLRQLLLAGDVSGGALAYMVDLLREMQADAGSSSRIAAALEQDLLPELLRRVPADDAGALVRLWDYMVALLVLLRHMRMCGSALPVPAAEVVRRILSTVDRTVDQYRLKAHAEEHAGGTAPPEQTQGATKLFMLRHLIESIGGG
jgi:hypothetical protein